MGFFQRNFCENLCFLAFDFQCSFGKTILRFMLDFIFLWVASSVIKVLCFEAHNMYLLCSADVHLGRVLRRAKSSDLVLQAWQTFIDYALQHVPGIDVVLLVGDILDNDGLFFEMYGILKEGLIHLQNQGISVVCVAGNHDLSIVQQMMVIADFPKVTFLGRGGTWERHCIDIRGKTLCIDGYSWKSIHEETNPFDRYDLPPPPKEAVAVGILHCDVPSTSSCYAPVQKQNFHDMPHQAWLLGHIHSPQECVKKPFVAYCGSLQGLDRSEEGPHGVWELWLSENNILEKEFQALAPWRWESVTLNFSLHLEGPWQAWVTQEIEKQLFVKLRGHAFYLHAVGVSLFLQGSSENFHKIIQQDFTELEGTISLGDKLIPYYVVFCDTQVAPGYSLERLAEGSDFIAVLAKQLMQVSKEGFSEDLRQEIETLISQDSTLCACKDKFFDINRLKSVYLQKGLALIGLLHEQKEL